MSDLPRDAAARRRKLVAAASVVLPLLIVGTAYLRAPGLPYVWDDRSLIANNPLIQEPGHLSELLLRDLFATDLDAGGHIASEYFRPLTALTFWLQERFGELAAGVGHALNLVIHLAACLAVGMLFRRLGFGLAAGALGALYFGLNPIQSEAVYWISARGGLLATTFVLLGAHASLIEGRAVMRGAICALVFLLALLSKETALAGAPLLALGASVPGSARFSARRLVAPVAGCAIAIAIYLIWRSEAGVIMPGGAGFAGGAELLVDIATTAAAMAAWIALPFGLSAAHDYAPLGGLGAGLAWVGIAGCGALAVLAWRRGRRTSLIAWLTFLAAAVLVGASVRNIGVIGERYCYLPVLALTLYVADVLAALIPRALIERLQRGRAKHAWIGVAIVIAALFAPVVWIRSYAWSSEKLLFASAVETSGSSEAKRLLASDLAHRARDFRRAASLYRSRVEHRPDDARSWNNLAGCLIEIRRFAEALEAAERSRSLEPDRRNAWLNLATAQTMTGRPAEALRTLDRYAERHAADAATGGPIRFPLDARYREVRELARRRAERDRMDEGEPDAR
jgi:hypothetical protein